MDSPHFMRLFFLLLTIAAPCPNIAMPSGNPAEGRTDVTVYHCKDCKSNVCESSDYEKCLIIGKTQNKIFSNEIISLETNETHITMCFLQGNTSSEGIYAIFWQKAMGIGESCGMLNSGAISENVGGDISKTCCRTEADPSVSSPPLKCYLEPSGEKSRKPNDNTTDEENLGNPKFSIGERSSTAIIIPPVILVVLIVALAVHCARRNRSSQGPVIVLHQIING